VERIVVDYYGTQTPLNQIAGISTPDAHLILIQPWDRSVLSAIERAITKSDIGLMPNVDGQVVRLNVPPLTEERRRDMVKLAGKKTEEHKVALRNIRREANDQLKKLEKDGGMTKDDLKREEDAVQKITDKFIAEADKIRAAKEEEIMEI
jgi:ribosome recycling factor